MVKRLYYKICYIILEERYTNILSKVDYKIIRNITKSKLRNILESYILFEVRFRIEEEIFK